VIGGAGLVLGTDIERKVAGLATGDEQLLNGRKIGLGRAVLFQDVAPAPGTDLEIEGTGFSGFGGRTP
jgi:hypothetical protein